MSFTDLPYSFEKEVEKFLSRAKIFRKKLKPTGLNKTYYLDLIEPFIRQAVN